MDSPYKKLKQGVQSYQDFVGDNYKKRQEIESSNRELSHKQRIELIRQKTTEFFISDDDELIIIALIQGTESGSSLGFLRALINSDQYDAILTNLSTPNLVIFHKTILKWWLNYFLDIQLDLLSGRFISSYEEIENNHEELTEEFYGELVSSRIFTFSFQKATDYLKGDERYLKTKYQTRLFSRGSKRLLSYKMTVEEPSQRKQYMNRWNKVKKIDIHSGEIDPLEPICINIESDASILGTGRGAVMVPAIFLRSFEQNIANFESEDWKELNLFYIESIVTAWASGIRIAVLIMILQVNVKIVDHYEEELRKSSYGRIYLSSVRLTSSIVSFVELSQLIVSLPNILVKGHRAFKNFKKIRKTNISKDNTGSNILSSSNNIDELALEKELEDLFISLKNTLTTMARSRKPLTKVEFIAKFSKKYEGYTHKGDIKIDSEVELEGAWKVYSDVINSKNEILMGNVDDIYDIKGLSSLGMDVLIGKQHILPNGSTIELWSPAINDAWIQGIIDSKKSVYFGSALIPNEEIVGSWKISGKSLRHEYIYEKNSFWKKLEKGEIGLIKEEARRAKVTLTEMKQLRSAGYFLNAPDKFGIGGSVMVPLTSLLEQM